MRIHCYFSGPAMWDCERRLIFKGTGDVPQANPESKKDINEYVKNIAKKGEVAQTVYDFLKTNDPKKEMNRIRSSIEEQIGKDPDIQKMTVAEFKALMKGIPDDQNKLIGFLFANGVIEADEYNSALALGVQNRPMPGAKNSNAAPAVGTPNAQSKSGVKGSPMDSAPKVTSDPPEEEAPRAKTKSSPADKGSIVKDEKYWDERVVREREDSEQFKRDVAGRFKDVTPKNKEAALANLREEMGEMQQELEQLQRDRKNAADQKMMNRPRAASRYTKAGNSQMGDAYQRYSAELRDIGARLAPLTKEYNLLNEQHVRLSGKRFGEWRKGSDPEYAAKLNQQQKRDQALAMKMDREYDEEKSQSAKSKAEGDRVLGLRSRDPAASRFAGIDAENRSRVAGIMGWDKDSMNGSSSGNDVKFAGKIQGARDRGMDVRQRGNNYAYIDKTGKYGEFVGGGGGQFSVSDNPNGPRNAPSKRESKFTKDQNTLKEGYADRMASREGLEKEFKDLIKKDPDAKKVWSILMGRIGNWEENPQERYGDLAWARSQLETIRSANKQQASLKGARDKFQPVSDRLEGDPLTKFQPFILPIDTVDPYLQIPITIPGSVDPYGKPRRVLVQPNRLEELWGKNDGQILKEAGVWIEKDTWDTGKARGLKIHFTKEGLYNVNGTPWPVGAEAGKDADNVRESRNTSVINTLDFPIPDGASVIRILRLPKRTNIDLPIPQNAGVVDADMGISLIREKGSKNLRLTFSEEGNFQVQSVNTRMQDFRILNKALRVERQKAPTSNPDSPRPESERNPRSPEPPRRDPGPKNVDPGSPKGPSAQPSTDPLPRVPSTPEPKPGSPKGPSAQPSTDPLPRIPSTPEPKPGSPKGPSAQPSTDPLPRVPSKPEPKPVSDPSRAPDVLEKNRAVSDEENIALLVQHAEKLDPNTFKDPLLKKDYQSVLKDLQQAQVRYTKALSSNATDLDEAREQYALKAGRARSYIALFKPGYTQLPQLAKIWDQVPGSPKTLLEREASQKVGKDNLIPNAKPKLTSEPPAKQDPKEVTPRSPEPKRESAPVTTSWFRETNNQLEYKVALGGFQILPLDQMIDRIATMPLLGSAMDLLQGSDLQKGGYLKILQNRICAYQDIAKEMKPKDRESLRKALKDIDALPKYPGNILVADLGEKNKDEDNFSREEAAFLLRDGCLNAFRKQLFLSVNASEEKQNSAPVTRSAPGPKPASGGTVRLAENGRKPKEDKDREAARQKAEEEASAKKKVEEDAAAKKKAEEEAIARKKVEEDEAAQKKVANEVAMRKKQEAEKQAKEVADRKAKEDKDREAARQKAEEEASAKKKVEEDAAARKKVEEESKKAVTGKDLTDVIHNIPLSQEIQKRFGTSLEVADSGEPLVQEHIRHLALLPKPLVEQMIARGVRIKISNKDMPNMDSNPKWQDAPRGWTKSNWSGVPGGFDGNTNIVYAGKGDHGSISLVLHEYGHAFGKAFELDSSPVVIAAHKRLYDKLPSYLQQGGPGGFAGRQEFLAESFGNFFMKSKDDFIRKYDKELYDFLSISIH